MQSFPKPLSAKEEKECIVKCRSGDREARDCLIERNLRLVAYIAKKYNMGDKDMDDLISIGTIGLIKGIDSFDETKKYKACYICSEMYRETNTTERQHYATSFS